MQLSERMAMWDGPKVRFDWLCRVVASSFSKAVTSDRLSLVIDDKGEPMAWVIPARGGITEEVAGEVRDVLDEAVVTSSQSHGEAWKCVVEGRKRIELTEDSYDRLLELVQHPRKPNERLQALMAGRGRG
ncbi:MAG TPA: DUF1778 domain-containing protein [Coriobacteriia bacterium]|jgi:hypothetical protein